MARLLQDEQRRTHLATLSLHSLPHSKQGQVHLLTTSGCATITAVVPSSMQDVSQQALRLTAPGSANATSSETPTGACVCTVHH